MFPNVVFTLQIFGRSFGITEAHISLVATTLCIGLFFIVLPKVSNIFKWLRNTYYGFINKMVEDNAGHEAEFLTPIMSTFFSMILFGNLIGLIPGVFPSTCDIYLNLIKASIVIFGTLFIAIYRQGSGAISLFCPSELPLIVKPMIFVLEFPLFFLRIATLSGRLFLNITAGHLVVEAIMQVTEQIKVFAPIYFFVMGIEIITAFLQAYIFTMLSCVYLGGAFKGH